MLYSAEPAEIETNPSSLLVPVGTTAVFKCKIRHCPETTCSIHWIINGNSTAYNYQQNSHEKQGFIFNNQHNITSSTFIGRLTIMATVRVNNMTVCCLVQDGITSPRKTKQATLFVISGTGIQAILKKLHFLTLWYSGHACMQWRLSPFECISIEGNSFLFAESPLILNPSVKTLPQNLTSFLIEWSPPFLWPGKHIEHFIITVMKLKDLDSSIVHRMVNASFNDTIVSLTVELDTCMYDFCTCSEFLFRIFAIGPGQVELLSFNVTGRYLSCE